MEKTGRKKAVCVGLIIVLIILALVAVIFATQRPSAEPQPTPTPDPYVDLRGAEQVDIPALVERENVETIDLRGAAVSAEDVATLRSAHPRCRILWTVKVCQGLELENEAEELAISDSAQVEPLVEAAEYLGAVKAIRADYPNLSKNHYDALLAAFPNAEIEYSIVIDGREISSDTEKLDFSAFSYEEALAAAPLLEMLPNVSELELMNSGGKSPFSLDEVVEIQKLCPEVKLNYCFELFGMDVSTATERLEYYDTEIGDEGLDVFRKVIPIMHGLKYLRFDNCGTSDEAVAQLREDFPEVKVVWLLTVGIAQFYTDTIRIRANYNFSKEAIWKLKYCTDVKYIDCGHLYQFFDVEWARYMPNLEVCIVAMTSVRDISPLAECKNLEFLEIFTNNIKDLSPLAELENLEYLNISNMPITDITPIMGLEKLKLVNCNMLRSIPLEQIEEFRRLHPDAVFNYNRGALPTETGWRTVGHKYTERYALLREQMGYDDRKIAPYGYLPAPIE